MSIEELGVLVGVEGSACGDRALDWAATDAAARRTGLAVMTVSDLPRIADVPLSTDVLVAALDEARRIAGAGAARARQLAPGVVVQARVSSGSPAGELLRMAVGVDEVVVGSRGHGGFAALMLGSVAGHVAAHAHCPVVVVRGHAVAGGQVVVGADGSQRGEAALEYAFAYADRHGLPVHALSVYAPPMVPGPSSLAPALPYSGMEMTPIRDTVARRTAETVEQWSAKFPTVRATWAVTEGLPGRSLIHASEHTNLLVVGSRGHGQLAGMVLGSVSQAAVRHAHCPVAVVH